MKDKNLPIKLVLQKSSDIQKNQGCGSTKFFGDVTQELQDNISAKFSLKRFIIFIEAFFFHFCLRIPVACN